MPATLGRWFYCKYCYRNVLPVRVADDGLVRCARCWYGLAPVAAVETAGSLAAWYDGICEDFSRRQAAYREGARP